MEQTNQVKLLENKMMSINQVKLLEKQDDINKSAKITRKTR